MKRISLLIIFLVSTVCLRAQTVETLDATFENARAEFDAIRQEFADSADAALADYLALEAKLFEEYEQFRKEVMQTWGDTVMVESTRKEWVEYSEDRTSRTSVDWEYGKVDIEVLVDPSDDDATVRSKLETAVAELLVSRGCSQVRTVPAPTSISGYASVMFLIASAAQEVRKVISAAGSPPSISAFASGTASSALSILITGIRPME